MPTVILLPRKMRKRILKTIFIVILGVLFFFIPKAYLGETYPICLYRYIFNIKCIGCGTTRALWSIIHFKFYDAIEYNKLIIVTFPLLTGCVIHWIIKKDKKPVAPYTKNHYSQ